MFTFDPNLSYSLRDGSGHMVASLSAWVDEPLTDDVDGTSGPMQPLETLLLPKPASGNYTLNLVNNGKQAVTTPAGIYAYDTNGDVTMTQFDRTEPSGFSDTFSLTFNRTDSGKSSIADGYRSLRDLISFYTKTGDIKSRGVAEALDQLVMQSQSFSKGYNWFGGKNHRFVRHIRVPQWFEDMFLKLARDLVSVNTPRLVSKSAAQVLTARIDELLD